MAQGLGLTIHQLQFKTRHQLNELWERKLQRTFDMINSAALATQRKAEDNFARISKLAAQMEKKHPTFNGSSTWPHGLDKNKQKVISSDKSKLFKFTREPNHSEPSWETQNRGSLFVFGNVKTKKTLWRILTSLQFPQCVKSVISIFQNLNFQNSFKYRFYMAVASQNTNRGIAGGTRFK